MNQPYRTVVCALATVVWLSFSSCARVALSIVTVSQVNQITGKMMINPFIVLFLVNGYNK
jgi:hypothetical protein